MIREESIGLISCCGVVVGTESKPLRAGLRSAPLRYAGRASLEKELLEKKLVGRRGFLQAGAQHEHG
jgi:hypothetical protein